MSVQYSEADTANKVLTCLTPLFLQWEGTLQRAARVFQTFGSCGWQLCGAADRVRVLAEPLWLLCPTLGAGPPVFASGTARRTLGSASWLCRGARTSSTGVP